MWLLLLASACARGATMTDVPARDLVRRYVDAVVRDDAAAAYELLAGGVRQSVTYEDFARRWRQWQVERVRQAQALSSMIAEGSQSGERGRLHTDEGKSAELVREPTGWRLEGPLLSTSRAATPAEALRQLAAAVEDRSIDAVLATLTMARRERLAELLSSFSSGLRAHAGDTIEISGDRATVTWTDGPRRWRVVLKREDGSWRIDDFNAL